MEQVATSPLREEPAVAPGAAWLSTNQRHFKLSPQVAGLVGAFDRLLQKAPPQRLKREQWVRYRLDLAAFAADTSPSPVQLTPITAEFIDSLDQGPWHKQPQVRTAVNLWQHGLRGGYVWFQDDRPLCLQWLFSHLDNPQLQALPNWSGMYPPLPPDWGQVENLLSLPAGMRYPGGAAAPFALAMYRLAAQRGMRWLITHIHERNRAAHRWAERTGWTAYGHIQRYQPDLPLLRHKPVYLHETATAPLNPHTGEQRQ